MAASEDPKVEQELYEGLEPLDPSLPWDNSNEVKVREASKEAVVSAMKDEEPSQAVNQDQMDASDSQSGRKKPAREPKWPNWLPPDWHIKPRKRKSGQVDKYFEDPTQTLTFRSKKFVLEYLEKKKQSNVKE